MGVLVSLALFLFPLVQFFGGGWGGEPPGSGGSPHGGSRPTVGHSQLSRAWIWHVSQEVVSPAAAQLGVRWCVMLPRAGKCHRGGCTWRKASPKVDETKGET